MTRLWQVFYNDDDQCCANKEFVGIFNDAGLEVFLNGRSRVTVAGKHARYEITKVDVNPAGVKLKDTVKVVADGYFGNGTPQIDRNFGYDNRFGSPHPILIAPYADNRSAPYMTAVYEDISDEEAIAKFNSEYEAWGQPAYLPGGFFLMDGHVTGRVAKTALSGSRYCCLVNTDAGKLVAAYIDQENIQFTEEEPAPC